MVNKLMNPRPVNGIVLAGGLSSRAKANKMLFVVDDTYLIVHTINRIRPFVDNIYVVTGRYDKEDREALKDIKDIHFLYNENYNDGMYSSICCGLKNTTGDILLIPGDVPFVSADTYKALLKGHDKFRAPAYKGQTGHPIFLDESLRNDIIAHQEYKRLRDYRNAIGFETIDVDDEFITLDCDTELDLELIKNKLKEQKL